MWGQNTNINGTGMIGVGNGQSAGVAPNGSGGAFTGNITGLFARSNTGGAGEALIQLEENEDTRGVVVKNKTATGFDVVEIGGGTSNQPFQWQIVLNRGDYVMPSGRVSRYSDLRFEPAPDDAADEER